MPGLEKVFTGFWLVHIGLWGRLWLAWTAHLAVSWQFNMSGQGRRGRSIFKRRGDRKHDPADREMLCVCVCVCVCVWACVSGHNCRLESLTGCLFSFLSPSDRWQHYIRPLADTNYCDKSHATTYRMSDVSHIFDAGLIWTKKHPHNPFREFASLNLLQFIFSIRPQLSSTKWPQNVACSLPLFKAFSKSEDLLKRPAFATLVITSRFAFHVSIP